MADFDVKLNSYVIAFSLSYLTLPTSYTIKSSREIRISFEPPGLITRNEIVSPPVT